MTTVYTAVKHAGNFTSETINIRDVSPTIYKMFKDAAPFQALARIIKNKRERSAIKIEWLESGLLGQVDAVNGSHNDSVTTIAVDTGTLFKAGKVIVNTRTGEHFRVSSVSSNNLTVIRQWGTTAAAAMNDNDVLLILATAHMEGDTVGAIKSIGLDLQHNLMQIVRTPIGMTATAMAVTEGGGTYGGNNWNLNMEQASIKHLQDLELAMLFGERKEDTSNFTNPARAMAGIDYYITQNLLDLSLVGGVFTEPAARTWIRGLFKEGRGSRTRMVICDPIFLEAFSWWAKDKVRTRIVDQEYGISITEYFSGFGRLILIPHWMLTDEYGKGGIAFAIDPQYLHLCPLKGRDTHIRYNVQDPSADSRIDEMLTEETIELGLPAVHGKVSGLESFA